MHVSERTEHCAACYGQYGDRRYVDFEAAYDGPVLEGAIKVAIDDLVICENCLTAAAKMIGLVKAPDLVKALDDERAKSHADHMKMGRLERQIKDLKAALAEEEPTPEEEPVAA
jgi:hypothetical protein